MNVEQEQEPVQQSHLKEAEEISMNIKEHFSKMFITLGWALTGCVLMYALVFTLSEVWAYLCTDPPFIKAITSK